MKYLIIGNQGTLGSEFERLLGDQAICVDREGLDITNPDAVQVFFQKHQPKVVINCAAYTNVDGAETDYPTALQLNATAPGHLAKAANEVNATLIHFSTGMVFAGNERQGYNEDAITEPVNHYGESKLAGEEMVRIADRHYIIRTQWLYGKPQNSSAKKSFIELMIELGKTGPVKSVVDEIGKPTWSKDLAQATLQMLETKQPYGVYHLINEGQASRLDWTAEIYRCLNMNVEIQPVSGKEFPRPAARPHYELLNNTKLPRLRSWQTALEEYLRTEL